MYVLTLASVGLHFFHSHEGKAVQPPAGSLLRRNEAALKLPGPSPRSFHHVSSIMIIMITTKIKPGMNAISPFKRVESTLPTSWLVAHGLNRERSHDENADFSLLAAFAFSAKGKAAHSPCPTTIGCVRGFLFRLHIGITGPMSIKSDRRIFSVCPECASTLLSGPGRLIITLFDGLFSRPFLKLA